MIPTEDLNECKNCGLVSDILIDKCPMCEEEFTHLKPNGDPLVARWEEKNRKNKFLYQKIKKQFEDEHSGITDVKTVNKLYALELFKDFLPRLKNILNSNATDKIEVSISVFLFPS